MPIKGKSDPKEQKGSTTEGKNKLDAETAQAILNEAGGDKEEARSDYDGSRGKEGYASLG